MEDISKDTILEIVRLIRNLRDYKMNLDEKLEEKQDGPEKIKRKEEKMRKKIKQIDDKDFAIRNSKIENKYRIDKVSENMLTDILKELKQETPIDNIKFHIELPYTRPILSILTELKQNDIQYYILPIKKEMKIKDPTIKIYMDRKDIEKYKALVHNKISNLEDVIISICEEEIDIVDFFLDGCEDVEFLKNSVNENSAKVL